MKYVDQFRRSCHRTIVKPKYKKSMNLRIENMNHFIGQSLKEELNKKTKQKKSCFFSLQSSIQKKQ